jgi:hypothetical protein
MALRDDMMSRLGIAGELLQFFWHDKWWWLTPVIVLLLLVGTLAMMAQAPAIAPFIYTLF